MKIFYITAVAFTAGFILGATLVEHRYDSEVWVYSYHGHVDITKGRATGIIVPNLGYDFTIKQKDSSHYVIATGKLLTDTLKYYKLK